MKENIKNAKSICIAYGNDLSASNGGTNRAIAFANSLYYAGYDVHIVCPKIEKKLSKDMEIFTIHIVPINASTNFINKIIRGFLISLKAKKIAKKHNSILQIHLPTLGGLASIIGCSDFMLIMDDLAFESPVYTNYSASRFIIKFIYEIEKIGLRHATKVIVVSNPLKEFIISEWDIPNEKIEVIPNGYFEDEIKKLNLEDDTEEDTIAFMGSLGPKVDIDTIIDVSISFRDLSILVVGDGPSKKLLETKIIEHNLKNIILTGNLPYIDALELIAKSKVVIAPYMPSTSLDVSCPVKLFDYAALGKAMVIDDLSEIGKLFNENGAALVSNPENKDKFIENVKWLLNDKKKREEISDNAKIFVRNYTWEKQGEKLVKIYLKMK